MTNREVKRVRWTTYVPTEMSQVFVALSDEFGLTKGQLSMMLMRLGYEAFLRAYKPEKTLSESDWAKILTSAQVQK